MRAFFFRLACEFVPGFYARRCAANIARVL
jgi:hypothetical protein